jgi:hypothetical protein
MAGSGEAEDRMTDEERERRYTRFFGEGTAPLRAILDSPGGAQFWGKRLEGYGLGVLQQAMEEASRRKGKEPTKESPPRETERHKIQREEEQGNEEEADIDNRITKSKERFYKEKEGLLRLHRALQVVGGPRVEGYDLDLIDLRREYQPPEPESEMLPGREGDNVADLERVVAALADAPTLEPEDFIRDEILDLMVQVVEYITATVTPPSAATPPSTATPPSATGWVFLE